MPRLDFAFLADAAEAEPGRKFYVLGGGIDSINAATFPVVHPHISLVMRVLVHPAEADRDHRIEIKLVDSDGGEMARIEGALATAGGVSGREVGVNVVLNLVNTRFERPGGYAIEILVNDQHMKSLPLHLQHLAGPPPGHPG